MTIVLTRKECLDRLHVLGYEGPTSYLMPRLRDIVKEQERKAKKAAKSGSADKTARSSTTAPAKGKAAGPRNRSKKG